MKFFLSKYSALEVATLPPTAGGAFNSETFQQRAQRDVGGLFDFEPIGNHPAAQAALRQMRLDLATRFDYTSDGMTAWLEQFQKDYGSWTLFAHSMAYATLVPEQQSMLLLTHGELRIWRVRIGENPKSFQTDGKTQLEATQMGDIWLITTDSEKDNPTPKNFNNFVYDYATRLQLERTYKKSFYILSIENHIDTNIAHSIPNRDERIAKGVLAIIKQRIAAGQPFVLFESLLRSLSTHAIIGKEATALLKKDAPIVTPELPVASTKQNVGGTERRNSFDWKAVLVKLRQKWGSVKWAVAVVGIGLILFFTPKWFEQYECNKAFSAVDKKDFKTALPLLHKYKEANSDCKVKLGDMYASGLGVPKNIDSAMEYYKAAIDQNNPIAVYKLYLLDYNYNYKVQKRSKYPVETYLMFCNNPRIAKHPKILHTLALLYVSGQAKVDYHAAAIAVQAAAEQDDSDAQYLLAIFYYNGMGFPVNQNLAFQWAQKAADKNNLKAIQFLGHEWENTLQDTSKAKSWYRKGTLLNDSLCKAKLDSLNKIK